ncbi:MAG: polyphosphate polymerase domain-containing protein [Planctomycetota bacterium]
MTYHNRHECKFAVPEAVAARVLHRVRPFVRPDPHAETRPGHTYPIASLYLDDEVRSLYRETIEGRAQRFKLRIRAYDDAPDSLVFLEVKRRRDRVVQKLRCPVPRTALPALLGGTDPDVPGLRPSHRPALREFLRLLQLQRATPRLIVRYDREAYVGYDDDEVRVTVDRRLAVSAEAGPHVRLGEGHFEPLALRGVVLELKFNDRCPPWIADVVRACELQRTSFSKYCRSFDILEEHGRVAPA